MQCIYTTSARQAVQITTNAFSTSTYRLPREHGTQVRHQLSARESGYWLNNNRKLIGLRWVISTINYTADVFAYCW